MVSITVERFVKCSQKKILTKTTFMHEQVVQMLKAMAYPAGARAKETCFKCSDSLSFSFDKCDECADEQVNM